MKRLLATLLLLTNLATAQSWGPMLENQNTMLNTLSTDAYITLPGNLTSVLGLALKQQVRNTANSNLHEVWVGTPEGNRLLTMRGDMFTTTLTAGQQVIAIPHGLGYAPVVFSAHILNQPNYAYTLTRTSTYIIITISSVLIAPTAFTVSWLAR